MPCPASLAISTARVIQPHQLGGLVESFTGSVVQRLAEQLVLADAIDAHQLSVPTRNQQSDERKGRRLLFQHRCQQVTFHMVHTDGRHAPGKSQRLSAGRSHQQRADQARACRVSQCVDIAGLLAGLIQHLADQRQHALDVIARGQFRHDAAVDAMQVDLAEQGVSQQAALTVIERDAGFIAGGFQSQYEHGA